MKHIKKQKRAQMSSIGKILLIAATTIMLLVITYKIIVDFGGLSDREKCRLSVFAKSQSRLAGTESQVQLECHTQYLEIKKNGIYKKNREIYKTPSEENIGKIFASELYECWYMFGEGKQNPFSELSQHTRCVVCSQIQFTDNLNTNQIPSLNEYINTVFKTSFPEGTPIATSGTYYIAFKPDVVWQWEIGIASGEISLVKSEKAGIIAGITPKITQEQSIPGVYLLKSESQLAKECEELY